MVVYEDFTNYFFYFYAKFYLESGCDGVVDKKSKKKLKKYLVVEKVVVSLHPLS